MQFRHLALATTGSVSDPSPSPSSVSEVLALDNHPHPLREFPRILHRLRQGREVEVLADHPHRRRAPQAGGPSAGQSPSSSTRIPADTPSSSSGKGSGGASGSPSSSPICAEVLALDNHPHRRPPKKLLVWENITEWTRLRHAGCQCFWLCSCLHFGTHRRLLSMNICNTQRHSGRDCAAQKITTLAARWRTREKVNNKLECNG